MVHLLDDAFLRVGQAEKDLADLTAEIAAFIASERHGTTIQFDPTTPEDLNKITLRVPATTPPKTLSLTIGSIVQGLRSALDYLVYALVILETKSPPKGRTQFLIVDTPQDFAGKQDLLKGVRATHVGMIERYQPYNGCTWTKQLRDLSNPDKHRHLILLKQNPKRLSLDMMLSTGPPSLPTGSLAVESTKSPGGNFYVYVQHEIEIQVRFPDQSPVIETLEILKSQVAQILNAFRPEFK